MTTADKIAADLRDAFRGIEPPIGRSEAHNAIKQIKLVYEANDFDSALSRALAAIVALDDAEAAAAAEVKAAQARMATVTEAAEAESEFHKARLQRGGAKVEITAPDALPEDFWRIKREPDKALVKALLAKGQTIPGAALVQSPPSLVITAKDR